MHCGYELTGMRVEETCPECGKSIWSEAVTDRPGTGYATTALILGITALVTSLACIGPLAIAIAVPALVFAHLSRKEAQVIDKWPPHLVNARVGKILAWITIVLSIGMLALWSVLIFGLPFVLPAFP